MVASYLRPTGYGIIELPFGPDGRTDLAPLAGVDGLAAVALQSPNFFGVVEDLEQASTAIHASGALLVAGFTEPMAFGLYTNPGRCGADIACGEGQSLGLPVSYGGAALGMFACREEFVRNMPGRLVGETVDLEGRRGYVLTLSTREQHIRRSRAVSNICSNAGHCALTCAMFMASIGGTGFRQTAQANLDLAAYLKKCLEQAGFSPLASSATFNEFAMYAPEGFDAIHQKLQSKKILAGLPLARWRKSLPGIENIDRAWLFGATETSSTEDIDALLQEIKGGA